MNEHNSHSCIAAWYFLLISLLCWNAHFLATLLEQHSGFKAAVQSLFFCKAPASLLNILQIMCHGCTEKSCQLSRRPACVETNNRIKVLAMCVTVIVIVSYTCVLQAPHDLMFFFKCFGMTRQATQSRALDIDIIDREKWKMQLRKTFQHEIGPTVLL